MSKINKELYRVVLWQGRNFARVTDGQNEALLCGYSWFHSQCHFHRPWAYATVSTEDILPWHHFFFITGRILGFIALYAVACKGASM